MEWKPSMTKADLQDYNMDSREPVAIDYKDYRVTSCGLPASGAVALSVMKTVEGYNNNDDGATHDLNTHRLDEAMRFGYGKVSKVIKTDLHH